MGGALRADMRYGVACALWLLACGGQDDSSTHTAATTVGAGGSGGGGGAGGAACGIDLTWRSSAPISGARDHHASMVVEASGRAFLYVTGGWDRENPNVFGDVQFAEIQADGSLAAWQMGVPLTSPRGGHTATVIGDRVVLTGGKGFAGAMASVLVGQVGADGTIASWAPGPDLPLGRYHAAGVVHGRFLYSIGGIDENEAHIAEVLRLQIDESGAPGQWVPQTPLPEARTHLSAFVAGDFVYVVGGIMHHESGDTFFKDTLRAPLGADGTLGAWESVGQPLAHELATAAPVVHCDHAFLFGGLVFLTPTTEILRATLGTDGSLGAWELLSVPLPLARSHMHHAPVYGNSVYTIGGAFMGVQPTDAVDIGTFQ